MGVIARFYIRVAEVEGAMTRLRELGFAAEEENAPLRDPQRDAFSQPVAARLDAFVRLGEVVPPRVRDKWSHYIAYWSYDAWPAGELAMADAARLLGRIEEICAAIGADEFVCLADSGPPVELVAELEGRTFTAKGAEISRVFSR